MVMVALFVAAAQTPEASCDAWTVADPALSIVIVPPDILITPEPAVTEYVNAPLLREVGWVMVNVVSSPSFFVILKSPNGEANLSDFTFVIRLSAFPITILGRGGVAAVTGI
jgi:hypothetical protein